MFRLTYTRVIALGFLAVIMLGTLLLCLPVSSVQHQWTPVLNSAFTSVSATCVTGLVVYDTYAHWSLFGKIVILSLIQIGGIGFMTIISMFSIFARKGISLKKRKLIMKSAGSMSIGSLGSLIKYIIAGTVIAELIGAAFLTFRFSNTMNFPTAVWYGVFHSVSAFCNAGFDIIGRTGASSFIAYNSDIVVNITLMTLIIVGGLGFFVWTNIIKNKFHFRKLELHSKIVIITSVTLIAFGTLYFYFSEGNFAFSGMSAGKRWLCAAFQSVTTRTAGFNTINENMLSESGALLSMILMFIGGSPGSTAGGIKTTTIAALVASMISCARNEQNVIMFKRKLDNSIVRQAGAIVIIYFSLVVIATLIMCMIEPFTLKQIIFECISAIGTVGLSLGITTKLTAASRVILMLLMYTGRIGGLSFVLALAERRVVVPLDRPSDKILIG